MFDSDQLPTIPAERVRLRWLTDRDVPALFAVFSQAEVTRYWSTPPMKTMEEAEELLHHIHGCFERRELFQWGVARESDDLVLGTCTLASLDASNLRAELGFALGHEHWGHGYMGEALRALLAYAFPTFNLHRLEADVDPRNERSIRALTQLGFQQEGYLRERWLVGGETQDSLFFGLLRREWEAGASPSEG